MRFLLQQLLENLIVDILFIPFAILLHDFCLVLSDLEDTEVHVKFVSCSVLMQIDFVWPLSNVFVVVGPHSVSFIAHKCLIL
jgi:hypothetical protein